MPKSIVIAVIATSVVSAALIVVAAPESEQQVLFKFTICEGDPATPTRCKTLAKPRLRLQVGKQGTIQTGGKTPSAVAGSPPIEHGFRVTVNTGQPSSGSLPVDIVYEWTTLWATAKNRTETETHSRRVSTTALLGKPLIIQSNPEIKGPRVWATVEIEEIQP